MIMKTIVALYDDFAAAQRATQELVANGVDRANISLVANDVAGEYGQYVNDPDATPVTVAADTTAVGAGTGAVIGGIGGLLVGLGALAIPGIGPIIAAGPLVSALVGAGVGAVTGGLVGALTGLGIPEAEAGYYAEGVRRGGVLVTAQVPEDSVNWAMDILDRYNPVDIEERVGLWKQRGWSNFDPNAPSYTVDSLNQERAAYRADDTTQSHSRGWPEVEPPAGEVEADLSTDPNYGSRGWPEVEPPAGERDTSYGSTTQPVDSSGWTEIEPPAGEVEIDPSANPNYGSRGWPEVASSAEDDDDNYFDNEYSFYETGYRQHYDTNFANSGYTYEQYTPAYRYGYDLAVHPSYSNYSWVEVESAAQRSWEETNQGTWDQFKDAVRHAWERVKEAVDLDDDFDTEEKDFGRSRMGSRSL